MIALVPLLIKILLNSSRERASIAGEHANEGQLLSAFPLHFSSRRFRRFRRSVHYGADESHLAALDEAEITAASIMLMLRRECESPWRRADTDIFHSSRFPRSLAFVEASCSVAAFRFCCESSERAKAKSEQQRKEKEKESEASGSKE